MTERSALSRFQIRNLGSCSLDIPAPSPTPHRYTTAFDLQAFQAYIPAPLFEVELCTGANMRITNVQIYLTVKGTLRAYADVTFDNSLCVREFRLLHTHNGYVIRMPSVRQRDRRSHEIASALNDKTLKMIQDAVIAEYEKLIRLTSRRQQ